MEELDKNQIAELESLRAENERLKQIKSRNKSVELIAENETIRARLAELEVQEPVRPDWYQNPTSEQWFECPYDAQILEDIGAVKVGDIIELDVCWNGKQKFRVAKIADEQSDDVEFELIDGTHLFPAPVVSPDVEKLIADHNSDMAACHEQFMEVSREVMSLKAELVKATSVLEAARKDAESWRSYKKRKDEVIAAGMGRKILRDAAIEQAKVGCQHEWDSDGDPGPGETMTLRCRYCGEEEQAKGAAE